MTIKNLFAILIKLIGLIFILISLIFVIPGYLNLVLLDEIMYPSETLKNSDYAMSLSLIIMDILINILIYYFLIHKTEYVLKFLKIEKYFGDIKIDSIELDLKKYAHFTLSISAIILLIISIPEILVASVQLFRLKNEFVSLDSIGIIENSLIAIFALILISFNDKIVNLLTK